MDQSGKKHYIFGFGSLISPESRARTGDTGAAYVATIADCERSWSLRVKLPPAAVVNPDITGVSAVAVRLLPPANTSTTPTSCAGVVMEVSEAELPNFDAREVGYRRVMISLNRVSLHSGKECEMVLGAGACIWCYVDQNIDVTSLAAAANARPALPSAEFPIIQSYLDVIMDGCLQVGGESFARNFLETTVGWVGSGDSSSSSVYFLNDRAKPGYVRSSRSAGANASTIDSILSEYTLVGFGSQGVSDSSDGKWSNKLFRREGAEYLEQGEGGTAAEANRVQQLGPLLSFRRDICDN